MAAIEQRIYDGNRAKEILDNEVFIQVFADIEQELFDAWKQSPARDQEGRERIHQYQSMLQKVKTHLVSTMETGKLAQLDIQHSQSLLERTKGWIGME